MPAAEPSGRQIQRVDVVKDEAEEPGVAAAERVDGVVGGKVRDLVLAKDQDRGVGLVGKQGAVGEIAHGRRVHDDVVEVFTQHLQDLPHLHRAEEGRGVVPHDGGKQAEQVVRFPVLQRVDQRGRIQLALEQGVEALALLGLHAEDLRLGGLAHVAVHKQDLLIALCKAQRQVRSQRGFAFVFGDARDQEGLAAVMLFGVLHPCAELVDGFHVGEGRRRIGNQQRGFFPAEKALQRAVPALVPDRDQQRRVNLIPRADRRLHRAGDEAQKAEQGGHEQGADRRGDQDDPALTGQKFVVAWDVRGVDDLQDDRVHQVGRPLRVVLHNAGGHIICRARGLAGCVHLDDARAGDRLRADGDVVHRGAVFLLDLLSEHRAGEQRGELVGRARGNGRVAAGKRVFRRRDEDDGARVGRLHHQRDRDICEHGEGDGGKHDHPEVFQDGLDDAVGFDFAPDGGRMLFVFHTRLPHSTTTVSTAVAVSPEAPV